MGVRSSYEQRWFSCLGGSCKAVQGVEMPSGPMRGVLNSVLRRKGCKKSGR